ncbi:hypothetical protein D3C86_1567480 [compost metagenome]
MLCVMSESLSLAVIMRSWVISGLCEFSLATLSSSVTVPLNVHLAMARRGVPSGLKSLNSISNAISTPLKRSVPQMIFK